LVETAEVDALDEATVDGHADAVAASAGSVDVSFNLISQGDVQRTPLAEMAVEDFMRPVVTAARTAFLTSRAAARHIIPQGSGVILFSAATGTQYPATTWGVCRSRSRRSRPSGGTCPRSSNRTAYAS